MAIGAALAIGSGLISLYGNLKSAQANKRYNRYLSERQSDLDRWYNEEYNIPYLDTAQGQAALQSLRTYYGDAMKRLDQNSAIRGATDEAKIAGGERIQRNLADNLVRLAGYGTQYRDSIRREYQGLKANLDNLQQENLLRKSQNFTNLATNAANMMGGIAEAEGGGAFEKWDNNLSNWYKSFKTRRAARKNIPQGVNTTFGYA